MVCISTPELMSAAIYIGAMYVLCICFVCMNMLQELGGSHTHHR